ncbi:LysR family transcriptional regulator [Lutimaribacter sp. EGI FJ00015]|uniref:LysR family transcriptional regulator n=1 Tax=Lutimaribacter degradans TaxID=2945989 RepID=A0ACC5ZUV5_9RHOB|nr:LysR family transcriptional regulator [Lutimaribacter sp. EGI FJ00013]MCM2562076.1 LysR family transcriptional regulator [Lutimaribacter sp. EGI FJ00013]MCO0613229.1 LysR family transcriptional regulator [Lutimaribacter sp. EGI FJ00015]MCO0636206.1 LysR family transcriptional regulator [Lutimaribacter sp. EGI FJ00014]
MNPIPFSFRQIDYLLAVAESGSTAAAARALNVSQPSVSVAITQIEAFFGAPLFRRLPGQGMRPTPFGRDRLASLRALRTEAGRVFAGAEAAVQELRLGVYSTLGPRYAPMLMRHFDKAHPGAKVDVTEGDIATLTRSVLAGTLDLALVYDVGLPVGFETTLLAEAPPRAVLPPGHRLAGCERVDLRELALDPLILIGLPHSRGYFLSLFQMAGVVPEIAYETGSIEMLRALVANGHGVGLLATELPYDRAYDGRTVISRPVAGNMPSSRVVLIRDAKFAPTEAMATFEALARKTIADGA